MDKNIRVRTIKEQIQRLTCLMFINLFVIGNSSAHDTLFQECHQEHQNKETKKTEIISPVAVFKKTPVYPKRELNRGRSGAVIIQYTVTKEGTINNAKILSSTSSAFSAAAKQAVKKFRYEPAKIDGNPIDQKGVKHKFTFTMEGSDSGIFMESETLDFNPTYLTKSINKLSSNPQKAINKINDLINKEENGFHIAVLKYILSVKYYQLDQSLNFERLQSIKSSMAELEKLNQDEINVINLRSMNINAISFILLQENKNSEAKDLLEPFLLSAWKNNFHRPSIIYDITVNYAIAAYNSADYCSAFYGFDRAIKQGKALSIKNPNIEGYREAARKNMG